MLPEVLRRPLLCRALDAAMTASLRPRRTLGAQVRAALSPRSSGYDRVAAAVNALDLLLPGTARRTTAIICREMDLPFPSQRVELLAFGSGATVFLARCGGAARVVKVYRSTMGVRRHRLPDLLTHYRGQYERMQSIYRDAPGVVWPAEFMVIGGPILERRAIACVQEFLGRELRDFFEDFSLEQAGEALAASGELRRQFLAFAEPTLRLYRSQQRCPDLLGHRNLAVAGTGAEARLRLIDYRLFDVGPANGRAGARRQRLEACLGRIEALARTTA